MRLRPLGIAALAALSVTACSKNGSDPATFCPALVANYRLRATAIVVGTPDVMTRLTKSTDQLAAIAPAPIKSAIKTEAAIFDRWEKTGDDSIVNNNPKIDAAELKVQQWATQHCQ